MKTKLLIILFLLLSFKASAQNDLKARIEYEAAEEAFATSDYQTASVHLVEAEKLLGRWTPKVGFLLIVSLSKILDYENPNTQQLENLNKQIKLYMQYAGKNEDIDMGKFKEVNAIEKEINNLQGIQREKNDPEFKLAMEHFNDKDYANALVYFAKAAKNGGSQSMRMIGKIHGDGLGVPQSWDEAIIWYKKAVERGNSEAMCLLGVRYENGQGVTQNYSEAMNWYRKAAEKGNSDAMSNMAYLYLHGKGVTQSYGESMNWYRKAAKEGNATAMANIGFLYDSGKGVAQNYTEAMNWYKKAAEQGNVYAMNNIGILYENGQGVAQNYIEAINWYKKAAEQGNVYAMNNIGILYENGQGVNRDYIEAMNWYKSAAEKGGTNATFRIGYLYKEGKGVKKNYHEALQWFLRAYKMDQKDWKIPYSIYVLYDSGGYGIEKDKRLAKEWQDKYNLVSNQQQK